MAPTIFHTLAFILLLMAGTARSEAPRKAALESSREFAAMQRAMGDRLYDIAAVKGERMLRGGLWTAAERTTIIDLMVESYVRAGNGAAALAAMNRFTVSEEAFWRGQALLLIGDFAQADRILADYQGKWGEYAMIARAHAFVGQGREAPARGQIKALRESDQTTVARHTRLMFNELEAGSNSKVVLDRLAREKGGKDAAVQYLRARTMLELNEPKKAEAVLRDLLSSGATGMGPQIHDAATVLLAESLWRQHLPEARSSLVSFMNSFGAAMDARTTTEYWGEAFALLDRIAAASDKPDPTLLPSIVAWASQTALPERHGYALYSLALELNRDGRSVEATGLLEALLQLYPNHPKASEAMRLAMQLHGAAHADVRVLQLAGRWRQQFGGGGEAVVDFVVGLIHFMRGEYKDALMSFTKAADSEGDLSRRRRALYNAGISAVKAGERKFLATIMSQLSQTGLPAPPAGKKLPPPSRDTAADLDLDKALELAARLDPGAENELTGCLSRHPEHPRRAEALLALAEFRLLDVPPRVKEASEALESARQTHPDPAIAERIGYVQIWLHEATDDLTSVARESQAFLASWPESTRADEVRMKLAEAYYRLESFAKARTEFELLSTNHPNSPYADAALYFAGMAAMALPTAEGFNAAITTWGELVERGGPLAFAARQQQAIATGRRGDYVNALKLYDALLENPEATLEQKLSLRCEKAELLLSQGKKAPQKIEESVKLLRETLAIPELPYVWAGRCGVLLARALRDLAKPTEALEACYDVINVGSNVVTAPNNPSEYLWFYRAGFLAVELLEATQKWEAAALMAEKIAQSGGDRAKDAAERATKIRLKHFLWDTNN